MPLKYHKKWGDETLKYGAREPGVEYLVLSLTQSHIGERAPVPKPYFWIYRKDSKIHIRFYRSCDMCYTARASFWS